MTIPNFRPKTVHPFTIGFICLACWGGNLAATALSAGAANLLSAADRWPQGNDVTWTFDASQVIQELENLSVKPDLFRERHLTPPLVLRSRDELQKYLEPESFAKVPADIDFNEQVVVIFAWQGSGQDQLEFTIQESFPETIQFDFRPGRTRDLRRHTRIFTISSRVTLRVLDQQISLAPAAADDLVQVTVRGRLNSQVMAIGGETTGVVISAGPIQWELEFADPQLREQAAELHEQRVQITGELTLVTGVEIPQRWLVKVQSLKALPQ